MVCYQRGLLRLVFVCLEKIKGLVETPSGPPPLPLLIRSSCLNRHRDSVEVRMEGLVETPSGPPPWPLLIPSSRLNRQRALAKQAGQANIKRKSFISLRGWKTASERCGVSRFRDTILGVSEEEGKIMGLSVSYREGKGKGMCVRHSHSKCQNIYTIGFFQT